VAVATAVEAVPVSAPGAGEDGAGPGQGGEGGFAGEPAGVVADGDQQLCGGLWADAVGREQGRGDLGDEGTQVVS
jgi:hypothetical protein